MAATDDSPAKFKSLPQEAGYVNVAVMVDGTDLTPEADDLAAICVTYLNDKARIPAIRCGVYGIGAATGVVPGLSMALLKFLVGRELKKVRDGFKRKGRLSLRRTLPTATIQLTDLRSVSSANFLQLVELLPRFQSYIHDEFQGHVITYRGTGNPDLKPHSTFVVDDIDISDKLLQLWDGYLRENSDKESIALGVRAGRWGQPEPYCSVYPSEWDVQKAADASRPSRPDYPGL
ncbi:hypothetical protein [Arthrobacter sp. R4-81]